MGRRAGPHRPSKRLGQNFLVESSIAEQVVSSISPGPLDIVLEPGPGHGTLTRILLKSAGRVVVVEKDPALVQELHETFRDQSNLTILYGDILKLGDSLPSFNKLVSTPPYYISSKLTLFLTRKLFDVAGLVFQKEFGDRLLAEPGGPDYGRLSVMTQRKLDIERVQEIPRTAFNPKPKVDSTLLRFSPRKNVSEIDEIVFDEMVRGIFTQRRRLLKSALSHFLELRHGRTIGRKLVGEMRIPDARVFQLSIGELEDVSLQLWGVTSRAIESGELVS